jgi:hypothetical protein
LRFLGHAGASVATAGSKDPKGAVGLEFLFGLDLILDGLERRLPRREEEPWIQRSGRRQEGVAITSSVVADRTDL